MKKTISLLLSILMLTYSLTACSQSDPASSGATKTDALTDEEIVALAEEAYTYCFPLVLTEMTKQQVTNVAEPMDTAYAPVNQFGHKTSFPDPTFKEVVRPNLDTLYSSAFLDVGEEPIVLSLPEMGDRYYLMPMLDAWSEVFASPGTRTNGGKAETYLIASQDWEGEVPEGMTKLEAPTDMVWIIGRTMVNGNDDLAAANEAQRQYQLVPLSQWGSEYVPEKNTVDTSRKAGAPKNLVLDMSIDDFFNLANELMVDNPPHDSDGELIARLEKIGVGPGLQFSSTQYSESVQEALGQMGAELTKEWMELDYSEYERVDDNWTYSLLRGNFDNNYLYRAYIALAAFGTNVPEDAIYPNSYVDADGDTLTGENQYRIHFEKDQLPPAKAFWSLTAYDTDGFLADNADQKYAVKSTEDLYYNPDGSLDIYIQTEKPEGEQGKNWLPVNPATFTLHMRVYWPTDEALEGNWDIPPLEKVSE